MPRCPLLPHSAYALRPHMFRRGIFLVYPQVASTTLGIFACDELENRTFWLMADYRLQCYTPTHRLYIGIGAMWTLLLPFGLPASFLYLLYQAGVPELSRWKRECGWLRSIAQRALVLGVPMDGLEFDPDTLTLESISTTHLRLLHRVFVNHELDAILADKARPSVTAPTAVTERTLAEALKEHLPKLRLASMRLSAANASNSDAAPSGPPDSGEGSKRGEHTMFDLSSSRHKPRRVNNSTLWEAALARREKMQTIFAKIRIQLGVAAALRNRGIRRRLSMLFYRNERELLIMQLLDWAKHDTSTLVAEPRQNQLRWRTHYEWHSLRVDNVPLSERDKAERNAFFKYRFLFAAYAVHAWYWCASSAPRFWRHDSCLTSRSLQGSGGHGPKAVPYQYQCAPEPVLCASRCIRCWRLFLTYARSSSAHSLVHCATLVSANHCGNDVHVWHGAVHHRGKAVPRARQQPTRVSFAGQPVPGRRPRFLVLLAWRLSRRLPLCCPAVHVHRLPPPHESGRHQRP